MTTAEGFARYLDRLRADAGVPSIRQMATHAAYGKSTISEALSGRRLPTRDVARKLVAALGGDDEEARKLWAEAKGSPKRAQQRRTVG